MWLPLRPSRPLSSCSFAALALAALCLGSWAAWALDPRGSEAQCEDPMQIARQMTSDIARDSNCRVLAQKIVCQGFLGRFYTFLKETRSDFSVASIESELIRTCKNTKEKENRLCYYLGATSDAATKIVSEVSRPMSAHVPVSKICEKLKKADVQICELKYERKLDLTSVDLSKLKVAELRKILESWGEVCRACIEKTDLVNLIKELAPKHAASASRADL